MRIASFRSLSWFLLGLVLSCSDGQAPERVDAGSPLVTGDILIKWTYVDAEGQSRACESLGIADVRVALGGEPQTVSCGEAQEARFPNRLGGVYPVLIQVRSVSQTILQEHIGNVSLSEPGTREYEAEFVFDPTAGDTGILRLRWFVRGGTPSEECALLQAETVRIQSQLGSIADLQATAPCEDGELTLDQVRPGSYTLRFLLIDGVGETIVAQQRDYRVTTQGQTEAIVNFVPDITEPAGLWARWTVNGTTAVAGCVMNANWSLQFRLTETTSNDLEIATATSACEAGGYRFADLLAPPNPALTRYRLRYFLQDPLRGTLTSSIVDDLRLESGTTATVTVDLITE